MALEPRRLADVTLVLRHEIRPDRSLVLVSNPRIPEVTEIVSISTLSDTSPLFVVQEPTHEPLEKRSTRTLTGLIIPGP